jgi:hypothetical protein
MPVTVKVNGTVNSLVHKMSSGMSVATIPDVCKTPTPGGPVPMPYPNIAQSITLSNGTTTVKGDKVMCAVKGSKFALSNGDQPGTVGGVKSNVFMKEATWILYSFDVKLNGKNAARFTDKMFHNKENTVNLAGEFQQIAKVLDVSEEEAEIICTAFCNTQKKYNQGKIKGRGCCSREFAKQLKRLAKKKQSQTQFLSEQSFLVPVRGAPALLTANLFSRIAGVLQGAGSRLFNFVSGIAAAPPVLPGGSVTMAAAGRMSRVLKRIPGAGRIFRPDLVIPRGPGKYQVFDAKFEWKNGKDKLSTAQRRAYRRIDHQGKPKVVNRKVCGC